MLLSATNYHKYITIFADGYIDFHVLVSWELFFFRPIVYDIYIVYDKHNTKLQVCQINQLYKHQTMLSSVSLTRPQLLCICKQQTRGFPESQLEIVKCKLENVALHMNFKS